MANIKFTALKNNRVATDGLGSVISLVDYKFDIDDNTNKSDLPFIQVFDCGYRVSSKNIVDWNIWNGCVFIDIDSKKYYTEVETFDADKLEDALCQYLLFTYNNNFYWIQKSNSGTSYHIAFYFDVPKNEDNYYRAVRKAQKMVIEAFTEIGLEKIIKYDNVLDRCTVSPFQGLYVTSHQFTFGAYSNPWFGKYDNFFDDEDDLPGSKPVSDVKKDGTKLFEVHDIKKVDTKVYLNHISRLRVYQALKAVHGSFEETQKAWEFICNNYLLEGDKTIQQYINQGPSNFYNYTYSVNVDLLKQFGYKITRTFEPIKIDFYKPDVVYEISEDQFLSDIHIQWSHEKINHLYAGCAFGKTYFAKNLGVIEDDIEWLFNIDMHDKRVCFVTPMKSISKDAFESTNNWEIIDEDHKERVIDKYGSVHGLLWNTKKNICTTWESYYAYDMHKISFDYVIVDEIHTFFMYDYRIESINNMKKALNSASGIRIIMTGTPSAEVEEFDCYKIQVKKKQPKVPTEIVLFKNDFKGHWLTDIRDWTSDPNHYAIIFQDRTNYKMEELFERAGMRCTVFNTNYEDNVEYILDNHNVFSQITAFSVYGQAGINLYIDTDKKVRIYILNKNGLGIIQYANRVRNKDVIDKVMIGYPVSEVKNSVRPLSTKVDYDQAEKTVEIINKNRFISDVFDIRTKELIKLNYGIPFECLDIAGDNISLNRDKYKTWKMIKNVGEYERQLQVIYNRLIDNYFDVKVIRLLKDTKDISDTKLLSHRFAGQMTRFDFDMFIEKEDGGFWLKPTEEFKKICTGNLVKTIENIFNMMYNENNGDFEKTKDDFKNFVNSIIRENKTIKKKDISNYELMLRISKDWDKYYDNAFVTILLREDVNVAQIAALYVRSKWVDGMDWKVVSEEAYDKINALKKVVDTYKNIFANLNNPNEYKITVDALTEQIYSYLVSIHTRGNKTKAITLDGVTYTNIDEAIEKTGLSRCTIYRRLKSK